MKTTILDILKSPNFNSKIKINGWVRTKRGSKNVSFIALNDGSTIKNLQVVAKINSCSQDMDKNKSYQLNQNQSLIFFASANAIN